MSFKRGVDWDVFDCGDHMSVQRIDETGTMTDDEAVIAARASGMIVADDGRVLDAYSPTVTVDRQEWERMRVEQNAWRQCEDRIASLDGYEHTTKCVIFTSFFEAQMKGIALTPSNAVESQNTQ